MNTARKCPMSSKVKNRVKKTFKVLVFIGGFIAVERFCHSQTEGFMLNKIKSNLTYDARWVTTPLSEDKEKEALSLLDQPYFYLKSGGQGYSFISQDGKTVLKFFKMHHMREIPWIYHLHLPGILDLPRQKIVNYRTNRFNHIFGSCKIAFEEMQEHTALIYSHLNKTNYLNKKITIYDKLGIIHTVDLDQFEFMLQKKVDLVFPKFHNLMENGDIETAKKCIDSILELFVTRYQKGIHDNDPIIRRNFGFYGTKAIEIDLGSYLWDETLKSPEVYKPKLQEEMQHFRGFIQEFYPVLTPYLEEKISLISEEQI